MTAGLTMRHTGLQVPDPVIKLLAPGVLGIGGEIVGEIAIDVDDEFAEVYRPVTPPAPARISVDGFFDWVCGCRTVGGEPVDPGGIFDYLRAEYQTEFALKRAARHGLTVAQAMVPHGDGYMPGPTLTVANEETRHEILHRADLLGQPDGTWWRIFNGSGWDELDPPSV